jgi:hypothetical protein
MEVLVGLAVAEDGVEQVELEILLMYHRLKEQQVVDQ